MSFSEAPEKGHPPQKRPALVHGFGEDYGHHQPVRLLNGKIRRPGWEHSGDYLYQGSRQRNEGTV